ncbi:MAG TPA: FKBP-type peptidyl-prolyl cis-trans isomerase [Paludibacter sp.]|nr:FKBP-type peptidyl-prolyl cis-trans isomerase [Paludibacter sp.]
MKRINIFLIIVAALSLVATSCTNYKEKPVKLNTELDSLNYSFGFVNGNILRNYHLSRDTTDNALQELMKGIKDGLKEKATEPQLGQVTEIGTAIGNQLKSNPDFYGDSALTVNFKLIRQGLINGISGENFGMDADEARIYFNETMEQVQIRKLEVQYKENKEEGEKFLAENAKKEGVLTTESGLQYEIIKAGNTKGNYPSETDKVRVHYHGTLIDGTVFDSSVERGEPTEFGLNQVIKGWTEGLQLMPVGAKYRFYIPQELAYGPRMQGSIKPFSVLIFDVELLAIVK